MKSHKPYRIVSDMIALTVDGDEVTGTAVLSAGQTLLLERILDEGKTAQLSLRGQRYLVSSQTLRRRSVSGGPEFGSCSRGDAQGSCCLEMHG
jgi:hypothetical protein